MTTTQLLLAAVAVGTGALAGQTRPWAVLFSLVCLLSLAGAWFFRRRPSLVFVFIALLAGAAADASWRLDSERSRIMPGLARSEAISKICGTATSVRPRSFEVAVRMITASGRNWKVREPVRVRFKRTVTPGLRLCARGSVVTPRPHRREPPLLAADWVRTDGVGSPVRYYASIVRMKFSAAASAALPKTQAGLLLGMTEGDTALLDEDTVEQFRTTGLAHLVAVSGSNVAMVLVVVMLVCRTFVRRSRWLRLALATGPLVFFAFLTALEASVLRATVSAAIVVAISAAGRTPDALRAAALAFIALVLISPQIITNIGFQLSFAATLGLVVWAKPLSDRLIRLVPNSKFAQGASVAIATAIAAQMAVAPLLALHFGRLPAFGGVANLLVAPLAPVVMVGGMVMLGLASVHPIFSWAPSTLRLVLDAILWVAGFFAGLPHASVAIGVAMATAMTAGLAAALAKSRRTRIVALTVALCSAATTTGQAAAGPPIKCVGDAEIRALDVDGTAVLLRAAGHTVLYDGGPKDGNLPGALKRARVDRIDLMIASHPHADHTQGLAEALSTTKRLIGPPNIGWGAGAHLLAAARKAKVPVAMAVAGDGISVGPSIHLDVISPEDGPLPEPSEDAIGVNNLVIKAKVGKLEIVLPGDASSRAQAILADEDLVSPILLAVHHGSADLDPGFVDAVDPKVTIIGVGAPNPYGHPTKTALALYASHGKIVRTDRQGDIVVCGDSSGISVTTEK